VSEPAPDVPVSPEAVERLLDVLADVSMRLRREAGEESD